MGGWLETDNRAISVQFNLTGTATGTELGKKAILELGLVMQLSGFGVKLNPDHINFYFKHSKFFLGHGPSAVMYHALWNFFVKFQFHAKTRSFNNTFDQRSIYQLKKCVWPKISWIAVAKAL